jgi:hypothetical protein
MFVEWFITIILNGTFNTLKLVKCSSTDKWLALMERGIIAYINRINHLMMKPRLVNHKGFHSFISIKHTFLRDSSDGEQPKRKNFRRNSWNLSLKAKSIIAFAIIAVMLISIFAFIPKDEQSTLTIPQSSDNPTASPSGTPQGTSNNTDVANTISKIAQFFETLVPTLPKGPGLIESAQTINSTIWRAVAANAWQYFQPGIGVDYTTGLPAASHGYPYFTDWDLGVYIQTVIDANTIGLIGYDGAWGSHARLEKVIDFLETRELENDTIPFWFYTSTGGPYQENSNIDAVDAGRLFVALYNLKIFDSSLASRVDDFVYNKHNRTDYAALVPGIKSRSLTSTSIYDYYVASGFASFFPELSNAPDAILNNMRNAGNVTTYGNVSLPKAYVSCEPLLCSVFELNNTSPTYPILMALAKQVYLAHEAKCNETGEYVAFSEGGSPQGFIWEWVVLPNGETWKITGWSGSYLEINHIIYNKVAFSFLALYNTVYARNVVIALEQCLPDPTSGYSDGADNSGNLVSSVGSNTNGLILSAARYAIQNNP